MASKSMSLPHTAVRVFPITISARPSITMHTFVYQKLLSELARDPGSGKFKDLERAKDDQPMQRGESFSGWGCGNGSGANP
jgi:hypothetical protein